MQRLHPERLSRVPRTSTSMKPSRYSSAFGVAAMSALCTRRSLSSMKLKRRGNFTANTSAKRATPNIDALAYHRSRYTRTPRPSLPVRLILKSSAMLCSSCCRRSALTDKVTLGRVGPLLPRSPNICGEVEETSCCTLAAE